MAVVNNVYIIEKKHRHKSVKKDYLFVKKINSSNASFKVQYCSICRKYFCSVERYERDYKDRISNKLFVKPQDDTFIKDTSFICDKLDNICLNRIDNFNKEHHNHDLCKKTLEYKKKLFELIYCKICDAYGTDINYYHNIKKGKKLDEENIDEDKYTRDLKNTPIEFLIRINSFFCNSKKHSIEEIIATVNVYNKRNGNLEEVEVIAFYCKKCKLYFIYDSEYNKIIRKGIPICPVHEELKYFASGNDFDNYKAESLLRQFGYTVNSKDNLSSKKRHEIIELVLNNGFMNKHEILSHLSFLANSRKKIEGMSFAVDKWNEDISFVSKLNVNNPRKVKIGAFKKYIKKNSNN